MSTTLMNLSFIANLFFMKKTIAYIFCFLFFVVMLQGQEKKGNEQYNLLGYSSAVEYYEQLNNETLTTEIKEKIANSYRLNSEYEAAEYWYSQVIADSSSNARVLLQYAQVLQSNGKCEEAVSWYKKYQALSNDTNRSFLENCEEVNQLKYPYPIEVKNCTALNSEFHDFSPIPHKNGIVFTSMRTINKLEKDKDFWTNSNFSDLFFAEKKENDFATPVPLEGAINKHFHDGVATFDDAKKLMLFTRNAQTKKNKKQLKHLQIFSAKGEKETWNDVQKLAINGEDFSSCHPTLSKDKQTLYFASDRPGGFGGMDIYASKRVGNQWATPTNLGPTVNSSGNEVFPFIDSQDKLFFASDGHKGLGGLDIFVIKKQTTEDEISWANRKNLGAPINSIKDDFGFFVEDTENAGYLSSNRVGGQGEDDIYRWMLADKNKEKTEDLFDPNVNSISNNATQFFKISICDAKTGALVPTAKVGILNFAERTFISDGNTSQPSAVLVDNPYDAYGIKVNNGIIQADASFKTNEEGAILYPIGTSKQYTFFVEKQGYHPKTTILTYEQLKANPNYCIELNPRDCITLKGRIKNQDFEKYISGATIAVFNKCLGETFTLQSDYEGRFELCMDCNCEYELTIRKEYFATTLTKVSSVDIPCEKNIEKNVLIELKINQLNPALNGLPEGYVNEYFTGDPTGNYQVGQTFTLNNIYYDFDKYNIRSDAQYELDYLTSLMDSYPEMEIFLSSHTDSRGKSNYNQWLSRKRAKAAKWYLTERGIAAHRIQYKGYGEVALTNPCADGIDCSEEEHQLNRRTEVKILKVGRSIGTNLIGR